MRDRRFFLTTLLGLGLAALTGASLRRRPMRPTVLEPDVIELLRSVLSDPDSARPIGAWFLERFPKERDWHRLTDSTGISDLLRSSARGEASREVLLARIRDDFSGGRVVSVDGWVLSETEARLCALVALS